MKPFTLDRTVRLLIGVALAMAALWLVYVLRDVLLPFCVAALLAYMFEPFVQFNRRLLRLKGRVVAIFVTLFETAFFIALLSWIFVPMIANEVQQMGRILAAYATTEFDIPYIPSAVHHFIRKNLDVSYISDLLSNIDWPSLAQEALRTLWNVVTGGLSLVIGLFSWVIVILYVVFIMIDYDRLGRLMRQMVPPRMRHTCFAIGRDIKTSMNRYFRGQALVAFIVGILFCIGFLIIGLPMAIVMGLFIGLLNMVPYLQLLSLVPVTLLCLVYSVSNGAPFWPFFGEVIVVYCVVQVIQDLFLTPKIMGKAMGLNPALILLSLSIWGTLLGFLGLIIALPLTTLLLSYYNQYIIEGSNGRKRRRKLDALDAVEDFPPPAD